jgi:hypothetical protein
MPNLNWFDSSLKGTVARAFLPLVFSTNWPHIVPEFTPWNIFEFIFEFAEIFVFECCSAGFDTPQDFVKQGIRPRRKLFCGVSDPAEQVYAIKCTQHCYCSAGSDTPQDLVLRGLIPGRVLVCGGKWRPRSLPFSLKGHFSKIVCMYKLHYPRHIWSMLKEPPIWKFFLCSAGSDTPQHNFEIWISPRIRTRIQKCFRVWIRGPYGVDSWKKPGAKNLVLLYL